MNGDTNDRQKPPDDPLLEELAALAREEQARDPDPETQALLDRYAAGELSAEEEARLTASVPNTVLALYRPLGTGFRARAEKAALEGLTHADVATHHEPAPVVPLPAGRRRTLMFLVPLAAAAGIALWVARPTPTGNLAEYALQMEGGEATARSEPGSAPGAVPVIGPGSRLSLVLRPSRDARQAVVARAWLVREGQLRPWPVTPEISAAGAVRVAGTFESLGFATLPPGEWEAVVVVATPDHLPDEAEVTAALKSNPPSDAPWRMQRGRFRLRGPQSP